MYLFSVDGKHLVITKFYINMGKHNGYAMDIVSIDDTATKHRIINQVRYTISMKIKWSQQLRYEVNVL